MHQSMQMGTALPSDWPTTTVISSFVPLTAAKVLSRILVHVANGRDASVVPTHAELTTEQAADMLNVSHPYLICLLEAGEIAYRMVGTNRQVLTRSLLDYRHRDDARRRAAADELTTLAQDMALS
jgi:excisionase family DNA binding protein